MTRPPNTDTAAIVAIEDAFQIPTYAKHPIAAVRGQGCYLWDADGRRFLDFYGGHCVTPLGHCPPTVVAAIKKQADTLVFYSNVVYSPVRARAAETIVRLSPAGLEKVYFCNSGTEANETALKLARKFTGRSRVVAFENGFHGRTLGSLAVTWADKYRAPYANVLPPTDFAPLNDVDAVADLLRNGDVAAVILEPIQSMAGMIEASSEFVSELRTLCDATATLLIFDEVQTGVGRTGTFSISEQLGVVPDMITMAKSLGAGVPVGAVLVTDTVAGSVSFGDQGSTFGGGMLAMAAVEATLSTIETEGLMRRATEVYDMLHVALVDRVAEMLGRGCLIGIKLDRPVGGVIDSLREQGVLVGSSSDPQVMRLMPPMNTPGAALEEFVEAFDIALVETAATADA